MHRWNKNILIVHSIKAKKKNNTCCRNVSNIKMKYLTMYCGGVSSMRLQTNIKEKTSNNNGFPKIYVYYFELLIHLRFSVLH